MRVPRLAATVTAVALMLLSVPAFGSGPSAAASRTLPRVRFEATGGGSMLVYGTYPTVSSECVDTIQPVLRARYSGAIEVGRDTDGSLFVVGELPFEDYLRGIAEVPTTWPMAALKAQVVAARSYALAHLTYPDSTGDRLGYDLCASDQCQVYRGWGVSHGPDGDRWSTAVSQTAGRGLMYGGRPADALYFSTSPGYTIGNEKVFGGSPLPYLRPVNEKDDHASALSYWRARIPDRDVGRFLRAAGDWGSAAVTSAALDGSDVVVHGKSGVSTRLSASDFRADLNTWGPCKDPGHYPGTDSDGTHLPQTVPSKWFDLSNHGDQVVIDGRGWGHGVGMVQWGAYGKAKQGMSYGDILAFYYGGLRPKRVHEPDTIRVGIATGLKTVTIVPDGPVKVSGSGSDGGPNEGPWLVKPGKPIRVGRGSAPAARIDAGAIVHAPRSVRSGRDVTVTVSVPQRSVVSVVASVGGEDVPLIGARTMDAGTATLTGTVPEVESGTFDVRAVVTDGTDIVSTPAREVRIRGLTAPAATTAPPSSEPPASTAAPPLAADDGGGTAWALVAAAIGAGVVAGVALGAWLIRRRRPSGPYGF